MDTCGASDELVRRGLRTVRALPLLDLAGMSLEIDWNGQANGCYLEAAIYLSPETTDATPEDCRDWWKLCYIGGPPGKTGRAWSSVQLHGGERTIYTEGWPERRAGRALGRQRLSLRRTKDGFQVSENGLPLFSMPAADLPFAQAYVCVQVTSHSNYPLREVLFDDIRMGQISP